MDEKQPTRIGIITDGFEIPRQKYKALKRILEDQHVEITYVGVLEKEDTATGDSSASNRFWYLLRYIYENKPGVLIDADFVIAKGLGEIEAKKLEKWWISENISTLLSDFSPDINTFSPKDLENEWGCELPDKVVDDFISNTDIVINLQTTILKGRILEEVDLGVISSHGADIRRYRGRPSGVWQLLNGETKIGRTFQILTPRLDGGKPVLISHRDLSAYPTLWEILLHQKEMEEVMFTRAVERLIDPNFEPSTLEEPGTLTHSSDRHRWSVVLRVLAIHWKHRIMRFITNRSEWNTGSRIIK